MKAVNFSCPSPLVGEVALSQAQCRLRGGEARPRISKPEQTRSPSPNQSPTGRGSKSPSPRRSPIRFGPRSPSPPESPTRFGSKSPGPRKSPTFFLSKSPSPPESPTWFGPRSPSPRKSPISVGPKSPIGPKSPVPKNWTLCASLLPPTWSCEPHSCMLASSLCTPCRSSSVGRHSRRC